jgi:hypothetical protein
MHELTETIKNDETLVITSTNSYIYECPICGKKWRYAVPIKGQKIFCNGEDFGTKIEVNNLIFEINDIEYLKNVTCDKCYDIVATEDNINIINNLWNLGVVKQTNETNETNETDETDETDEYNEYIVTDLGKIVLEELNKCQKYMQ